MSQDVEDGSLVYVGNLPPKFRLRDVEPPFLRIGKIKNSYVNNGNIFIQYYQASDASRAVRMLDGNTIGGRRSRVQISVHGYKNSERNDRDKRKQPRRKKYESNGPTDRNRHNRKRTTDPPPLMTLTSYPPYPEQTVQSLYNNTPSVSNLRCYSPRSGRELPPIQVAPSPEKIRQLQGGSNGRFNKRDSYHSAFPPFEPSYVSEMPRRDRHGNIIEELPKSKTRQNKSSPQRNKFSTRRRRVSPRRPTSHTRHRQNIRYTPKKKHFPRQKPSDYHRRDRKFSQSNKNRPYSPAVEVKRNAYSPSNNNHDKRQKKHENYKEKSSERSFSPGKNSYSYEESDGSNSDDSYSHSSVYSDDNYKKNADQHAHYTDERQYSDDERSYSQSPVTKKYNRRESNDSFERSPYMVESDMSQNQSHRKNSTSPLKGPRTPSLSPQRSSSEHHGPHTPPPRRSYTPTKKSSKYRNDSSKSNTRHNKHKHDGAIKHSLDPYNSGKSHKRRHESDHYDNYSSHRHHRSPSCEKQNHTGSKHHKNPPRRNKYVSRDVSVSPSRQSIDSHVTEHSYNNASRKRSRKK